MNTRDTLFVKDGHLYIGGIDTVELARRYGTPLYVLDEAYVREVAKAYKDGLESIYGKDDCAVAYASKALSCIALYKIVKSEGLWTDVVSGGELYAAMKAGFNPSHIIMHGNNKTAREMTEGIEAGVGYMVVDGYDEIDRLDKIASGLNAVQKVLLRVNPLVEAHTHHAVQTARPDSKFGVIIGDEAELAIKHILEKKNLKFAGIHCHIGSQIFDYNAYTDAVKAMVGFIGRLKDAGIKVETLNMGGGFGIYYTDADPMFTPTRYSHIVKNLAKLV
ncbi:MAG: diaminopimelate decarboxylase, partial [Clostridiales bacterium]|nr:diaminopimelate decarboxylase [Clostridiales bacterium]